MRREYGVEQLLNTETTPEAEKAIVVFELFAYSIMAFTLLCIAYYLAIGHLRPVIHLLF